MKRIVQYGAYPAILLGSVWGNLCLMEAGAGFLLSTYLPVTLGSLLIIWLELQLPYRASWKPSGKTWWKIRHFSLWCMFCGRNCSQWGSPSCCSTSGTGKTGLRLHGGLANGLSRCKPS